MACWCPAVMILTLLISNLIFYQVSDISGKEYFVGHPPHQEMAAWVHRLHSKSQEGWKANCVFRWDIVRLPRKGEKGVDRWKRWLHNKMGYRKRKAERKGGLPVIPYLSRGKNNIKDCYADYHNDMNSQVIEAWFKEKFHNLLNEPAVSDG